MSREAQLLEQIERLEEENRQLRELLLPPLTFPIEWGLSPQQARLLAAIYGCDGLAPWERLRTALIGSTADHSERYEQQILVFVRRKLRRYGVQIVTKHCYGVTMPSESRAIVRDAVRAASARQVA